MKVFIVKIVVVVMIMMMIVAGMHVIAIWKLQGKVASAYCVEPEARVLFIDSSIVGCAIDDDSSLPIKKLWISGTTPQSILIRLRELERRNQLSHVEICAIPFTFWSFISQGDQSLYWAFYQELPVAWRYFDTLEDRELPFFAYVLCNLRYHLPFAITETTPERCSFTERSVAFQEEMYRVAKTTALSLQQMRMDNPEAGKRLFDCLAGMRAICSRNGIRLVAFRPPLLPYYEENIPKSEWDLLNYSALRLKELGIEYIDTGAVFGAEHFFDFAHMTKPGARLFTRILLARLGLKDRESKKL